MDKNTFLVKGGAVPSVDRRAAIFARDRRNFIGGRLDLWMLVPSHMRTQSHSVTRGSA